MDPTQTQDADKSTETENVDTSAADAVKQVADQFAEKLQEMQTPAPVAAPAAAPPVDLEAKQLEIAARFDEMCAAGDFSGAQIYMQSEIGKISNAQAADPTDAPAFKSLKKLARNATISANSDVYGKYGKEIDEEIEGLTPAEQLDPDMQAEAVRRVKARHFDELMQDAVDTRMTSLAEEQAKRGGPRTAPGSLGHIPNSGDDYSELSPEQADAAMVLGYSAEEYQAAQKSADSSRITRGMHRNMVKLGDDKVKPGSF